MRTGYQAMLFKEGQIILEEEHIDARNHGPHLAHRIVQCSPIVGDLQGGIDHETQASRDAFRVNHMDVTTASRFHIGEIALSSLLRVPVIVLIGAQLWEVVVYELCMFAVVQVHHANIFLSDRTDRFLKAIIVTPYMHKVHHSRRQPETDSNYSSLFSFWDRLFGSFRMRDDPRTIEFGLDDLSNRDNETLAAILATPVKPLQRPKPSQLGPPRSERVSDVGDCYPND